MMEIVSETEATCRLAFDLNREAKGYDLILFASTYEESNCAVPDMPTCQFSFIEAESLPELTAMETVFDDAS